MTASVIGTLFLRADYGTRTHTSGRQEPKSCVSANSTKSACVLFMSGYEKRSTSVLLYNLREPSGTRTPDNLIKSQVLYRLS